MAHLEVEKKPTRPWWVWVLVVIILIALGVLLFNKYQAKNEPEKQPITSILPS